MQPIKEKLIDIIVDLETAVEFSEEDLSVQSGKKAAEKIRLLQRDLGAWLETYRMGKIVKEGFSLAIIGRPNVGKSSIFNALLALDRSIVTEKPGTTRDLVSEYANIKGIPVRLQDTAGIRLPKDEIEQLGISRSRQAIEESDCVLMVIDGSRELSDEDRKIRDELGERKCLLTVNKCDLPQKWSPQEISGFSGDWPWVEVSAKKGLAIDQLRDAIIKDILGEDRDAQDGTMVTNLRQSLCLEEALTFLGKAAISFDKGFSEEFALADLHLCLQKMGEVTGETQVEDLLGMIFSKFCIGK
jgi:tRNA modification GTPase